MQVIEIWILEFPVQVVSDLRLNNILSCKGRIRPQGLRGGKGYEQTEAKLFIPVMAESDLQELRFITQ